MKKAGVGAQARRWTILQMIEACYTARVVDALHQSNVLLSLQSGKTVVEIARELGWNPQILRQLLWFCAMHSAIISLRGSGPEEQFEVAPDYFQLTETKHLLDQYIGAYGPCLDHLHECLRGDDLGLWVNQCRHAAAFSHSDGGANISEAASILEEIGATTVLDIGCGTGALLVQMAEKNPDFTGIGIDANGRSVQIALRNVHEKRLENRVAFHAGDISTLPSVLKRQEIQGVQAVTAMSVANGFFSRPGHEEIAGFLSGLRRLFPLRILILADYYSRLGQNLTDAEKFGRTILHDVAQLLSGQGLPPAGEDEWQEIYRKAGCHFIKGWTGLTDGIPRFIHLLQL